MIFIMILLTHSLFNKSPISYSEIYVPDPSHFVHTSLLDGAQPSEFQDVFLAKSSPLVSYHLPYLIPCASAAPPLFFALILRASLKILNIIIFPPYILLPQRILYQYIPMSLLLCLYVISWSLWNLYQPMEPIHSYSLILCLLYVPT